MKRAMIIGGALALLVLLLALIASQDSVEENVVAAVAGSPATRPATEELADHPSLLHGRVTTHGGVSHEGRLRWGLGEEAFWGDYFNGVKKENPWAAQVAPERLPTESSPVGIFGVEFSRRERPLELSRPFMARFGDIERIDSQGPHILVTLKSGTVFELDRFSTTDFDDRLRVWEDAGGVVDLGPRQIRSIELLPLGRMSAIPDRLHGTARTAQDEFTGFLQWNRQDCLGHDELNGHAADGSLSLRFDAIRSIARQSRDGSLVTLLDGREVVLSGTPEVGEGNRGLYVDDARYGRILIRWEAFEHVDFSPAPSGPTYLDFPPGRALAGRVGTRDGQNLAGRLVFDLDESETTETLDAPSRGVDYTIPFGSIASIVPSVPGESGSEFADVTLFNGEELQLERRGDLGEGNAGMLVFADGRDRPEYVPWTDVERVDFARPPAMYPPLGHGRP